MGGWGTRARQPLDKSPMCLILSPWKLMVFLVAYGTSFAVSYLIQGTVVRFDNPIDSCRAEFEGAKTLFWYLHPPSR